MASRFAFSVLTCESQCMYIVHLAGCNWICENTLYNFNCKTVRKEAQSSRLGTKRRNFFFESGLLQKEKMAIEAFQICCLLLPPENRRKLQLLMRMMARICLNKEMPPLCDGFGTRTLVGWLLPSTVTPIFSLKGNWVLFWAVSWEQEGGLLESAALCPPRLPLLSA